MLKKIFIIQILLFFAATIWMGAVQETNLQILAATIMICQMIALAVIYIIEEIQKI